MVYWVTGKAIPLDVVTLRNQAAILGQAGLFKALAPGFYRALASGQSRDRYPICEEQ